MWKGSRVLVTGGAGFIGSNLVDGLLQRGAQIRVVDDLSRGKMANLRDCVDKIDLVEGDLADPSVAQKTVKDMDMVFHLAAVIGGVGYITQHPAEICKNVTINHNVIDACREMEVERALYTSTACIYPEFLQVDLSRSPLKEDDALKGGAQPDSNYGWAKLFGEFQCQAYHQEYGMKMAIVRPFNAYGPRECFEPDRSHVIPALVRKAVLREKPFIVWGSGTQTRAFTYVDDIVEAMILAIEKACDADPINLGTPEYITINELAKSILQLTGYDAEIVLDKTKPEGVHARRADISKANKKLGWRPKIGLEEGLRKTIDWFIENKDKI